jgi:hypothetical protein
VTQVQVRTMYSEQFVNSLKRKSRSTLTKLKHMRARRRARHKTPDPNTQHIIFFFPDASGFLFLANPFHWESGEKEEYMQSSTKFSETEAQNRNRHGSAGRAGQQVNRHAGASGKRGTFPRPGWRAGGAREGGRASSSTGPIPAQNALCSLCFLPRQIPETSLATPSHLRIPEASLGRLSPTPPSPNSAYDSGVVGKQTKGSGRAASPARPPLTPNFADAPRPPRGGRPLPRAHALPDQPTHPDPGELIVQPLARSGWARRAAGARRGPGSASALAVQWPRPGRPSRGRAILVSRGPTRRSPSLPARPPPSLPSLPPPSSFARSAGGFQSRQPSPPQPPPTTRTRGRGGPSAGCLGEGRPPRESGRRARTERALASAARTRRSSGRAPPHPAPDTKAAERAAEASEGPRARSSAPCCRGGEPAAGKGAPGCYGEGDLPSARARRPLPSWQGCSAEVTSSRRCGVHRASATQLDPWIPPLPHRFFGVDPYCGQRSYSA